MLALVHLLMVLVAEIQVSVVLVVGQMAAASHLLMNLAAGHNRLK